MNGKYVYILALTMLAIGLYLRGYFQIPGGLKRLGKESRDRAKEMASGSKVVKRIELSRVQKEIYEGLCILRSLAANEEANHMTGESVLVKLSKRGGLLEEVYLDMLKQLRMGKNEEAVRAIARYEKVSFAREYAAILTDWDYTEPEELKEIILTFQRSILRSRVTLMKRRDEVISDLIYIPAVFNVMLVFINFIYIGYFLEQKDMLAGLFG